MYCKVHSDIEVLKMSYQDDGITLDNFFFSVSVFIFQIKNAWMIIHHNTPTTGTRFYPNTECCVLSVLKLMWNTFFWSRVMLYKRKFAIYLKVNFVVTTYAMTLWQHHTVAARMSLRNSQTYLSSLKYFKLYKNRNILNKIYISYDLCKFAHLRKHIPCNLCVLVLRFLVLLRKESQSVIQLEKEVELIKIRM